MDGPSSTHLRWFSPEQPDPKTWPGSLEVAPAMAAVVIEA
jgi:hypothetical protein